MSVEYRETQDGFVYGVAEIERLHSVGRSWVLMALKTPKVELQLYITKTGDVRVTTVGGGEWKEQNIETGSFSSESVLDDVAHRPRTIHEIHDRLSPPGKVRFEWENVGE